jgi:hypothetical protein
MALDFGNCYTKLGAAAELKHIIKTVISTDFN